MKTFISTPKLALFAASLALVVGMGLSNQVNAQYGGYGRSGAYYGNAHRSHSGYNSRSYSNYRSGPVYHAPNLHYDRTYHADSLHWTPGRGLHTHGHYHSTPHYTPGHYDYQHRGHVHGNPNYHR